MITLSKLFATITLVALLLGLNVGVPGMPFSTFVDYPSLAFVILGTGSLLVTGNAQIDTDLITSGSSSYPTNIVGIMTPNDIGFNEASIDVMGLFYSEGSVVAQKQTNIMGTIISNYFDMGTNVPSIYQVPEAAENLPAGMIAQDPVWMIKVISWQKM